MLAKEKLFLFVYAIFRSNFPVSCHHRLFYRHIPWHANSPPSRRAAPFSHTDAPESAGLVQTVHDGKSQFLLAGSFRQKAVYIPLVEAPESLIDICRNGREIPLRHDIFDDDAIILKDTARKLRLCSPLGKRAVTFEFPNYPIFGLWHWPGKDAPYICLEAWSSLPSRKGVVEDLATQPDLVCLPANEIWRNAVTLSFE